MRGLSQMEKERYHKMIAQFPNLFITSYEEARGFKEEDVHSELKDEEKPTRQKLMKMERK